MVCVLYYVVVIEFHVDLLIFPFCPVLLSLVLVRLCSYPDVVVRGRMCILVVPLVVCVFPVCVILLLLISQFFYEHRQY